MVVVETNPEVTEEGSQESIRTWASRPYISSTLRRELAAVDALIVPNEGYGDQADLIYFPEGTEEVLHFLQASAGEALTVDIAIEEDDYKEISLRADWLTIAGLVVKFGVAPIVVGLLGDYIKKRLGKRIDQTIIKSTITVSEEKGKRSAAITYEGPASRYAEVMSNEVKNISFQAKATPAKIIPKAKKRQPHRPK